MEREYQGRVTQIIARAVCAKGKRRLTNRHILEPEYRPEQILGYWVGGHHFTARTFEDKVVINGKYEITVWYGYENMQKTDLIRQVVTYDEQIRLKETEGRLGSEEEVLVTEKIEPVCTAAEIEDENLVVAVEKAFSVEVIGETKMAIVAYSAEILGGEEEIEDDVEEELTEAEEGSQDNSQ